MISPPSVNAGGRPGRGGEIEAGIDGGGGAENRVGRKTALNRVGQNAEMVGPTFFLLGDDSSFVTGHSLVVDGGWTAW